MNSSLVCAYGGFNKQCFVSVGYADCSKHTCSLLSSWGLCSGPPGSLCYHWEFTEANFIWISFKLNPEIADCYLSWSYSKPCRSDPGISALATSKIASCLLNVQREGRLLHSWLTMSSRRSECLVNSFHNKTFLLDLSLRNVILVIIFQGGWENDPLWVGLHDALEWSLLCRIKSSVRAGEMIQCLEHWLLFPKSQALFPALTWKLTVICNSTSRESSVVFWPHGH